MEASYASCPVFDDAFRHIFLRTLTESAQFDDLRMHACSSSLCCALHRTTLPVPVYAATGTVVVPIPNNNAILLGHLLSHCLNKMKLLRNFRQHKKGLNFISLDESLRCMSAHFLPLSSTWNVRKTTPRAHTVGTTPGTPTSCDLTIHDTVIGSASRN